LAVTTIPSHFFQPERRCTLSTGRVCVHFWLLAATCSTPPPAPPSQEAVEQAWKRADQAVQQAAAAHDQLKHIGRLRDIDNLSYQRDVADLESRIDTLRGLSIGLLLVLLAAIVWLAIEIRRRRIMTAVVARQAVHKPALPACEAADT